MIGFLPSGERIDYGSGSASIFEISGVGHGFFKEGSNSLIPLTTAKGSAWLGNPIGLLETVSGYRMILETVGKKGTLYSEYNVSSSGVVSKKGTKVTSLQLVGKETEYSADLNQDGKVGLLGTNEPVVILEDASDGTDDVVVILEDVGDGADDAVVILEDVGDGADDAVVILEDVGDGADDAVVILEDAGDGADDQNITFVDLLTASFDDNAKQVSIFGLDPDVVSSEIRIQIFDNSLSPSDVNYAFSISPEIEILGDGNAIIAYNDLNRSIQNLTEKNKNIKFNEYESIKIQYTQNGRFIENNGEGSFVIDSTLFEMLNVTSTIQTDESISLELRSELGWDYSATDIELATIHIIFDSNDVEFIDADLEGFLTAYNEVSNGSMGQVNAGMAQFGDVYLKDGGLFGVFNFTKKTEETVLLEVEVYEVGALTAYDYPVGFTVEI